MVRLSRLLRKLYSPSSPKKVQRKESGRMRKDTSIFQACFRENIDSNRSRLRPLQYHGASGAGEMK
jgi:hypothetical protein